MIYGVMIENIDTLSEYGLILLSDVNFGTPEPRISTITIPGADGVLDFTNELSGRVTYGQRQISFKLFGYRDILAGTEDRPTEEHLEMVRQKLMNQIHGQKLRVWFPDDPDHYFAGRLAVGEKSGYGKGVIPISMTADPWRLKTRMTEETFTASGEYVFMNERMPTYPTITVSGTTEATVTFNGTTHALVSGSNRFQDIIFMEGKNELTFAGIGTGSTVKISYREGTL